MDLYREVKRLRDDVAVRVILRADERGEGVRKLREAQGQGDYSDVVDRVWDGKVKSGIELLDLGAVHVFSGYQACQAVRELMVEAKRRALCVVEYDEAPCEMCLGVKGALKRLYYAMILPMRVRRAVKAADLFISASGNMGMERLVRLGWKREAIVPFGYASGRLAVSGQRLAVSEEGGFEPCRGVEGERLAVSGQRLAVEGTGLRVLHTGIEAKYRGADVLRRAAASLKRRGVELEVKFTGGKVDAVQLPGLYEWADVVVACGICEPWGMRVNDVLLEGLPVVVSDGMGAAMLCDEFGCGCVVPKGDANALAAVLERCANDREFLAHLRRGAKMAAEEITPEKRARVWINKVLGE
jgi:glycosyltransferase involved in cell wall biosynthesis